MMSEEHALTIAVGVATKGRPEMLNAFLDVLKGQLRAPDRIFVAAPEAADVAGLACGNGVSDAVWIRAPSGLTKQRNAILRAATGIDVVVFFDDDFLPDSRYLAQIEDVFLGDPDVAMVTGRVIADGILGPGLPLADARKILTVDAQGEARPTRLADVHNGYGCNMAVRLSAAERGDVIFDECLPLYGWLEDVDFSRRLRRYGRIVLSPRACGVHLGVKSGRQRGSRLGYSQIANPIYLARKGSLSWLRALAQALRNFSANVLHSAWPEPYVDRRGRLRGNVEGVKDFLRGRLHPERILTF